MSRRSTIAAPMLLVSLALSLCTSNPHITGAASLHAQTTPRTLFASVAGIGGLFHSFGLNSWQGPSPDISANVFTLSVGNRANRRYVYAGTRTDLFLSRNGGANWLPTGLHVHQINAVLANPGSPGAVLVATDHGLLYSSDWGTTWAAIGTITGSVTTLTATAAFTSVFAAVGNTVWVSIDGGQSWSSDGQIGPSTLSISQLAVAPDDSAALYAATPQGVWKATGNQSWQQMGGKPAGHAITAIVASRDRIFATGTGVNAIYLSSDGGKSWSMTHAIGGCANGSVTALTQDVADPTVVLAGSSCGTVAQSSDDGSTWTDALSTVTGTLGNAIQVLVLVDRQAIPVGGVPNPNQAGVVWIATSGTAGHTIRGAFLAYWQAHGGAKLIGEPLSEEFNDVEHGGRRAQYFANMELLRQGDHVTPAPLGAEAAQSVIGTTAIKATTTTADPHVRALWQQGSNSELFGPPITGILNQTNGDGTGTRYWVQYFQNARLEATDSGVVQVGQLGEQALRNGGWL